MTICVIQGSPNKTGNGSKIYKQVKDQLELSNPDISFEEFYLDKEFNEFCTGCCTCFLKSEKKCPHYKKWDPIVQSLLSSDGMIFLSPSYVLGASAQMKAFLDHLGWLFIPHRPDSRFFNTPALILSTAAGAGTKDAAKTIKRSLKFWGVPIILSAGFNLHALEFDKTDKNKRRKINRSLKKKSQQFLHSLKKRTYPNLFRWIMTQAMKGIIKTYDNDNVDKQYWIAQGWLKT